MPDFTWSIALTANQAMRNRRRIEFASEWFDADRKDVPDDSNAQPKVKPKLSL